MSNESRLTKRSKKCPYCAEEINDEAIKCRYCGSLLNEKATLNSIANPVAIEPAKRYLSKLILVFTIFVCIVNVVAAIFFIPMAIMLKSGFPIFLLVASILFWFGLLQFFKWLWK